MVKRVKPKTESLGENPGVNSTRQRIKGDKTGQQTLRARIETLVKDKALKLELNQQAIADKVAINQGKGGKDLEHYSKDYMVDYEFTAKNKKLDKPVTINGKEPTTILRKVSDTEKY